MRRADSGRTPFRPPLRGRMVVAVWLGCAVAFVAPSSACRGQDAGGPAQRVLSKLSAETRIRGLVIVSEEDRIFDLLNRVPSGAYLQTEKDTLTDTNMKRVGAITIRISDEILKLFGLVPGATLVDVLKLADCYSALLASLPGSLKRKTVDKLMSDGDLLIIEALVLDETGTKLNVRADFILVILRVAIGGQMVEIWKRVKRQGEMSDKEKEVFPPVELRNWDLGSRTWGTRGGPFILGLVPPPPPPPVVTLTPPGSGFGKPGIQPPPPLQWPRNITP